MPQTLRIASVNVNGIRAAMRNGMATWLDAADVDILALQEVRAERAQLLVGREVPEPCRGHAPSDVDERLGVDPGQCVLVDDLEHNLVGAARLDIRGIHHRTADETIPRVRAALGLPTPAAA